MKLIDVDPLTHTKTYHSVDQGLNIITEIQDVEPYLEQNKRDAEQLNKKRNWWKVGSIPNAILLRWAQESGTKIYSKEWQAYAKKQLNSAEYRKLNPNKIKL